MKVLSLKDAVKLERHQGRGDALYIMSSSTSLLLAGRYAEVLTERLGCISTGQASSTLVCFNNLELVTYQNGVVSGKSDFHVDISKSPRGYFLFPR